MWNHTEGELRAFGQEHAAFSVAMQSREKTEELVNAMVSYESSEAWEQRLQSYSLPKAMTGITSVGTWSARHPLTGQAIVGSIVRWSPGGCEGCAQPKKRNEFSCRGAGWIAEQGEHDLQLRGIQGQGELPGRCIRRLECSGFLAPWSSR